VFLVRGVAVFPSAIEDIVRQFPEAGEFVADIHRRGQLDEMELRLEVSGAEPESVVAAVARGLHNGLGLRVVVRPVPFGTLPRFTVAARRFSDHREPREAR
jgi:phenylacetate-CoA ligase